MTKRYIIERYCGEKEVYTSSDKGYTEPVWRRGRKVYTTKEDAITDAKKSAKDRQWIIIEQKFNEKTFKVAEKIVADEKHC